MLTHPLFALVVTMLSLGFWLIQVAREGKLEFQEHMKIAKDPRVEDRIRHNAVRNAEAQNDRDRAMLRAAAVCFTIAGMGVIAQCPFGGV